MQGFVTGALIVKEEERAAYLVGLLPASMAEFLVNDTVVGPISLSMVAATDKLATRLKVNASHDHRVWFRSGGRNDKT